MSRTDHRVSKVVCDALESRRLLAAAGTLDSSFGVNGVAYAPSAGELQPFHRARVDSAGRTVGVGETADGSFYVSRLNVDGTVDNSFGPYLDGMFIRHFGSADKKGGAWDLAFQSDGKIVVVGEANRRSIFDDIGVVIRLNTNGTLDTTFDGDGIKTYRHSDDITTLFHAVKVQSDGKILVGGTRQNSALFSTNIDDDFLVLRFNSNGSLDNTFDGDGVQIVAMGDDEKLNAMAIDSVGRIVLVGTKHISTSSKSNDVTAIARLTANGAIDKTFDGDGNLQISYGNERTTQLVDVIIQDGDKIVVAGTRNGSGILLARFLPTGSLDQSFSGGWKLIDTAATEATTGLLKSWDNGILLSANYTSGGKTHAIVYKFTADGAFDTKFAPGGLASLPLGHAGPMADLGLGSHRFVMPGDTPWSVARIFDTGANVVYAATLNPKLYEAGKKGSAFVVYSGERLPYATRVYFTIGGSATKPGVKVTTADYTLDGLTIPRVGTDTRPYVDIPANSTFATVTVTPVDDTALEPTETVDFSIQANAATYDVGTPNKVGFTITDNDSAVTTTTLRDTADAYVYDGSANTNYGTATELVVKNGGGSLNRYSYLKFDLSSVSSIGTARLRIYGKLNNTNQTNVKTSVYSSGVTNWSESTITWNNKPTVRTDKLGEITVLSATAAWYEVDVSAYLRAEKLAGRNTVTLVLTNPSKSDPYTTFNSDEAASNRPELVITS